MILRFGNKILWLLIPALMIAAGCSSQREAAGEKQSYHSMTAAQRFDMLADSYGEWSQLNIPIKVEIASPTKLSVSGRAYMERDKNIFISLRFLGMEVASLYVDNDSVYVTDRFNKRYLAEQISDIAAGASVTVGDIQDLLLGRVFINNRGTITSKMRSEVQLSQQEESMLISPRNLIHGASYTFLVGNEDNILTTMLIKAGTRNATVTYSGPAETPHKLFMSESRINTSLGKNNLDVNLKWNFSSARWSIDNAIGPPHPKGYTRVKADNILKVLSSF